MIRFKFMGTEISITEERDNYNTVKLQYENIAKRGIEEFTKQYKENNKNLDDVINKGYEQGASIILNVINSAVDSLIDQKFYTINNELFIEKYCDDVVRAWDDAYNKINDKYMNIVLDENQKEAYRQYRKNSRGRWQGGGFGVQGAVKGAMQAGAMNAVTGMAHGTVNMIGRISSSVKANKQKSKVFSDPSTIYTLVDGLYSAIYNIHYSYIEFLEDNTNIKFGYVYSEESEQARVIFSNIKGRNIDNKEKIEIIRTLINLNPYDEEIYEYTIDNLGDENREVSEIANYFGYDINNYKYDVINSKSSTLKTNTEEETIKSKQILLEEIKRLGIERDISEINELDKKLNEFDIKARTVNGILFDTREEAKLANTDKVKIELILNKVNLNIETEVIEARDKILNLTLKTIIVDSYIKDLEKRLNQIDIEARTVNGILFDSREEATLSRNEYLKIKEIIDSTKDNRKSILDTLIMLYNMNLQSDLSKEYIHKLENRFKIISLKRIEELVKESRTFEGILFNSIEDVELAKKEKKDKESRTFEGILFNSIEDVELAKKEKQEIERWINNTSTKDNQILEELICRINNEIRTSIKEKYIKKIEEIQENNRKEEYKKNSIITAYKNRHKDVMSEIKKSVVWVIIAYIIANVFGGFIGNGIGICIVLSRISAVVDEIGYAKRIKKEYKELKLR